MRRAPRTGPGRPRRAARVTWPLQEPLPVGPIETPAPRGAAPPEGDRRRRSSLGATLAVALLLLLMLTGVALALEPRLRMSRTFPLVRRDAPTFTP